MDYEKEGPLCPLLTVAKLATGSFHKISCQDHCAWKIDGKCAIAIIAKEMKKDL